MLIVQLPLYSILLPVLIDVGVVAIEKGAFWLSSTTVTNFTHLLLSSKHADSTISLVSILLSVLIDVGVVAIKKGAFLVVLDYSHQLYSFIIIM